MLKKFKEIFTNTGPKILVNKKLKYINLKNLNNVYFRSFGKLNKNKTFYVIRGNPYEGFFSNITFILNHLKICDNFKFIPIINMENYPTLHNEVVSIKKVKNTREYYFKKLNNYSLKEIYKSKNVFLSSTKFEKNMSLDMTDNTISTYFKKIKLKDNIVKKANKFIKKNFKKNNKILGVYFRDSAYKTSRGHAFHPTIEQIIKNIELLIQKYKYNKIFLLSEDEKYLKVLQEKFKNKLVFIKSFKMNKIDSIDIYPSNRRYLLGEEILIYTFILSKCQGLTYIKSNIISLAIMLAKKKIKLHEISLGLKK